MLTMRAPSESLETHVFVRSTNVLLEAKINYENEWNIVCF